MSPKRVPTYGLISNICIALKKKKKTIENNLNLKTDKDSFARRFRASTFNTTQEIVEHIKSFNTRKKALILKKHRRVSLKNNKL